MDAKAWFVAGTIPLLVAGGAHALAQLFDLIRPTFFAPTEDSVTRVVDGTGVRLVRMFGVKGERPSMWSMWQGIHISHGVGVTTFGVVCLLISGHDFDLVGQIGGLRALTIAFPAIYLAIALRFWFWGPIAVTAASTACFTVSAILAG
jgi:hypothetical protein